jgi:uncharacterized protein YjbI with pentapeptide repeats
MILRSLGLALLIFGCPITLNAQIVEFQDSLFRVELFSNQIDTNNDGQFQQEEVDQVKSLNLTGGITDTIGLAQLVEFKNLERLTVLRVTGSGLRIEDLPKLKELYISEYIGVLDSIDFGKLPAIEKINLREMESLQGITFNSDNIKVLEFNLLNCPKLKKVGLFHCKRLYSLIIDSPNLEFLTIPKSPNLYLLEVLNASIKKLDIQNCPMIDGLDFYKFNIDLDTLILKHIGINYIIIRVPIKHIEMSNMDNLQSILIDSLNSFEELTLADFPALRTLNLDGLELKNLSLTNLPVLSDIFASNNKLESINLSGMELMRVDLSNNVLTEFRANNTKISDLNISHNNFTTLTEFKDLEIRDFDFRGNPTSLPNLEEFTSLSEIYMGNNGFDSLLNAEAFNVHTIFIGPDTTIKYIEVGQERLRDLFVFECGNLTRLDADNDGLRKIYVRDCPKFNSLNVEYLFWELIIQNTALEDVDLSNIIAQMI